MSSIIFLRPEKDGVYRLIYLNLTCLTSQWPTIILKWILSTKSLNVYQNCFMASIDIEDAYCSIPIKAEDRKFLRFKCDEDLYE